jgi:glycosyltransferase involved in cell wall biosynthesis
VSDREREDFAAAGLRAPVLVAPNGIDLSDLPAPAGVPTAVGPADGRVEFVFLGRLDPEQKGLDLLLDGLARSGLEAASVTLVGPDWRGNRRGLEALALKLGIAGRVAFAGPAFGARKLELLSRATVFVQTSRWEGLSFSVLEAAALGRPCLLTPAADPQSRFGPAGAAVVVEADGGAIAQGLQGLARMEPAERQALGARARRLVETEFTWPPTARRVAEAYRAHARGLQAS